MKPITVEDALAALRWVLDQSAVLNPKYWRESGQHARMFEVGVCGCCGSAEDPPPELRAVFDGVIATLGAGAARGLVRP